MWIIATHDLALGNLETQYPEVIKNWHFDALIHDDALTYSYKLQVGIARNMNASFLMRKWESLIRKGFLKLSKIAEESVA